MEEEKSFEPGVGVDVGVGAGVGADVDVDADAIADAIADDVVVADAIADDDIVVDGKINTVMYATEIANILMIFYGTMRRIFLTSIEMENEAYHFHHTSTMMFNVSLFFLFNSEQMKKEHLIPMQPLLLKFIKEMLNVIMLQKRTESELKKADDLTNQVRIELMNIVGLKNDIEWNAWVADIDWNDMVNFQLLAFNDCIKSFKYRTAPFEE